MDIQKTAEELSQMHVDQAKLLAQMGSAISASGEVGVLLWLSQRTHDTFAIDVVEHFGLTPGRVANIIKRLEQRGYIERIQAADDQRKVRIFLTDSGRERAQVFYDEMNTSHAHILEALGEEEAAYAMRILRHIISLIEQGIDLHSVEL